MVNITAGNAIGAETTAVPAAATINPTVRNFLKNGGVSSPQRAKNEANLSFNFSFGILIRIYQNLGRGSLSLSKCAQDSDWFNILLNQLLVDFNDA